MSDYGLEVRDAEGNIIIDSSTFTVRQVAKRFISNGHLIAKVGSASCTYAVDFPWAESRYGMSVSVTQLGLPRLPPPLTPEQKSWVGKRSKYARDLNTVTQWIDSTPRLPVVTAYDGFVRFTPAVYAYNADVWLSLYVVV